MASPVISGYQSLFDLSAAGTAQTNTGSTPSFNYNGGFRRLRIQGIDSGVNAIHVLEIDLDAPIDLSDAVVVFLCDTNFDLVISLNIGFSSGATFDTDWRTWIYPVELRLSTVQLFIDPSTVGNSTTDPSGGTFDASDVRRLRISWDDAGQSNKRLEFYGDPIVISKSSGLIVSGGDSSTPANIDSLINFLLRGAPSNDGSAPYWAERIQFSNASFFDSFCKVPVPFTLGDGVDTALQIQAGVIATSDNVAAGNSPLISVAALTHRVNIPVETDVSTLVVIGRPSFADTYLDLSPVASNFTNFLARDIAVNLGLGNYQGRVLNSPATVTSGNLLELSFTGSTAQYTYSWNGTADLSNSTFNSPLSDYAINFDGANFTDGATFDASALTFVSNPAVKKFRLDAAGKTLNLDVGVSGFTAADVDVIAGTLNVVEAQPTLTIQGIPAGGIFSIWDDENPDPQDLGTNLQTTDPTDGNTISYVGTAGNAVLLQFVSNTGESATYKEFNIPFTIPTQSQGLDLSTFLETEDNL